NANFNGTDSFGYSISDGNGGTASATVNVTVTPVNDAPIANNDSYNTPEDTTLTTTAVTGVLTNDTDVDGDTLTVSSHTNPAHGTLTLNANGSFSYVPNANFNGSDSFTYKANDGTVDSNSATVTINLAAVNDAPVAVADSYSTDEDTALHVNAATGVLGNDSDVDNATIT